MGFWQRVRDVFNPRHARFDSSAPVTIDAAITAARGGGASIGRAEALSVPAVQRGRNMLCSISTLPLVQRGPDRQIVNNPLFMQLDADIANVVTLAQTVEDLVFSGVSWWKITAFGFDNMPTKIRHLDVGSVSLTPPSGPGSPTPLPSGLDPHDAVVYVDGREVSVKNVIRFDSPNPAVLEVGGRAIRRALLLDKAAAMYADDPRALDYFSPADGADEIADDDVRDILAKWKNARKKRSTAWVPASMRYNTVDAPSPADLQLVELQKQASLDIANALGIDPEDLGVSTTSRTYSNDVDRRRGRVNDVLAPYMRAITDRLSMGDVTKRGYYVTFDLDDYLKSNPSERVTVQKAYVDMGVLSEDEVRAAEGYAGPAPGVDAQEPAAPGDQGDNPDEAAAIDAARRALVNFTAGDRLTFVDLPMTTFSVDAQARTIEGLALPYNKVGMKGNLRFRFAKGSLTFGDISRVKLLRDHDYGQPLGKAIRLNDTSAGFAVKFSVARGLAGDTALQLAEDGVLDGLSVGVDIEQADTDPKDKSVMLVGRAALREVSLTAMPAFDDARVARVAASRSNEGTTMEDDEPTTAPAQPAPPAAVTLSQDQFAALLARPQEPAPAAEVRPVVDATRRTGALTLVSDPAPYRFDRRGNIHPGSHEFSADLIAGLRDNDQAAHDRAMTFIRQQFDVVTTNVNELNPTGNRPDMYVDQRTYRYPVWEAINKGTLTSITPFTFPKFSSAGSLVAAHSEGSEPSSGTFVTTSDTVTPTALSGKAKISRETWDQGGNPQIGNLIWNQMLKGWYEALEAAAVAVLDAASPTGIDFSGTPGLANDDLDQALTAAFASLQFIRGGFSMNKMFTQIDLYKALVAATSADGRRLYPALGPANANGTVSSRFGSLDINGVEALPAWALAATGAVVASSYLFDSDSVHGWASAPQRLTIDMTEVANVYIGIWGYKATVISDLNGVREILYDPS